MDLADDGQLEKRLERLEFSLKESDHAVLKDALDLRDEVDRVIVSNRYLKALVEGLYYLDMWDIVKDHQEDEPSFETKRALVVSHLESMTDLLGAVDTTQLQSQERDVLDNYKPMAELVQTGAQVGTTQQKVDHLLRVAEELSIRSANMMKKWLESIAEDNREWIELEKRLEAVERHIKMKEKQAEIALEEKNRYK
ncbi:hypothetical protein TRVA0_041S00518 [Trichomonascus vanleenenianus]|uniref:uncharacterized protein n=1 Tax=Trichomonascus vanleenenianus TaxID=2268995 RepID=UPI003ECAC66D